MMIRRKAVDNMAISDIGASGIGYDNMAAGSSIVTASDNPAGLVISEKLETQKNSYEVGADNASLGNELIKTADGALASIADSLQRVRELSVQASNTAVYSASDISAMQDEVSSLLSGIQDVAKNTTFNTKTLLDGSMADMTIATNPDGSGMSLQMYNSTLESLGIADYDLTGNFNIADIDKAIESVSSARSSLGAQSNALESSIRYNNIASYNTTSAKSTLEDLDIQKYLSEKQKDNVMEQYKNFMLKEQTEQQKNSVNRLLT